MARTITLAHGNGGKLTHDLITSVFLPAFSTTGGRYDAQGGGQDDGQDDGMTDAARIQVPGGDLVFTTDSYVVSPVFFPGGDIGKLAVTGTINDLAVMGAKPLFLSCGMIIEDGFELESLKRIVESMASLARENGVRIVTGDTKVVEKDAADGIFINTAGIGVLQPGAPRGRASLAEGDAIIVSGTVGDHGIALYVGREGIKMETQLKSDCAVILPLVELARKACGAVRIMRDPTRGGLVTTLNEFVTGDSALGIEVDEAAVPIRDEVRGVCELLGFDPLYVANEGKLVAVVPATDAERVVNALREHPLGREAAIIGRVTRKAPGRVYLKTVVGGDRVMDMLVGDMLPRIC